MQFTEMRDLLIKHFNEMTKDVTHLFSVNLDKEELYNLYLDSFPKGTNEIYRERREYDCSCCRGFIKSIGNVVAIKNNKVETIWDFHTNDSTYEPVLRALSEYVKSKSIVDVYLSEEYKLGCHHNFEKMEEVTPKRWDHFYLELPDKYVVKNSIDKNSIIGDYRDTRNVFKRSLDEISLDAINTVLELINQNSLYKGEEWKNQLNEFKKYKKEYEQLTEEEKELYTWEQSVKVGKVIGRIRNHSMGVLLIDISKEVALDVAVKKYEQIVAPSNYKRSKPIYTQKMLENAKKKITELGYLDSLNRRYATLDDITINDILFVNRDASKRVKNAGDIFDELSKTTKDTGKKKFSKVEEVTIDTFINNILPTANEIELYFENKHCNNLMSLIASSNTDSKSMFKWGNNYSWVYSGNLTDSEIKQRVKAAGGSVTGDLRFSIQWNEDGKDNCDLDAHCKTPHSEIFFGRKYDGVTGGELDVDIVHPNGQIAVENITWADKNKITNGTYDFYVHQFSGSVKKGFRAEIEFDGNIYSYDYPHSMRFSEEIKVATVKFNNGVFTIQEHLNSNITSKEVWGVKTNSFIPVSVICYSPNYWDNVKNKVGHKHVFFMLKDCINDENPSGIFNEFLVQDLYEHRKVMEALASKMRVEDSEDQLSGLGFATDRHSEIIIKVISNIERIIKIKF